MRINAYAKINLALDVLGRRPDGYHEVRIVMRQLDLHDEIELIKLPKVSKNENVSKTTDEEPFPIRFSLFGHTPDVPCDERNIMYKAARLMMESFELSGGVSVKAVKHIPSQAGLGGGSADAAAVLIGMNELFSLGKTRAELADLGLKLGADVPYCVMGGTMLAEGIGEKLKELRPFPKFRVLLAKPAEGVSTKDIYEAVDEGPLLKDKELTKARGRSLERLLFAIEAEDKKAICDSLFNIFEDVTGERMPYIMELKERMRVLGAAAALMSGSGPTVYGFFEEEKSLLQAKTALMPELESGKISDLIATELR